MWFSADTALTYAATSVLYFSLIYFPLMFLRAFHQHVMAGLEANKQARLSTSNARQLSVQDTVRASSPQTTPSTSKNPVNEHKPTKRVAELAGKEVTVYRYHAHDVVKVADLPFKVPTGIKQYRLRKQPAIVLTDAKNLARLAVSDSEQPLTVAA